MSPEQPCVSSFVPILIVPRRANRLSRLSLSLRERALRKSTASSSRLQRAVHYQADTFASLYLQNDGDGTFTALPLPNLAQISPINDIIAHDADGDGDLDLIVAGNLYYSEPNTVRGDAGNGLWLRNDSFGSFTPVPPYSSGFLAPLQVTDLALLTTPTGTAVLVANNSDSLQAFTIRRQ